MKSSGVASGCLVKTAHPLAVGVLRLATARTAYSSSFSSGFSRKTASISDL
jgi:hypothetical protein